MKRAASQLRAVLAVANYGRLAPPEPARLMDDVLARQHHAVGALGLRGQDEKRESSLVEHLLSHSVLGTPHTAALSRWGPV